MSGLLVRSLRVSSSHHCVLNRIPKRTISFRTPPSQRPRSWKNSAARWGLALGVLYYLNTSDLASEQVSHLRTRLLDAIRDNERFATRESLPVAARESQPAPALALDTPSLSTASATLPPSESPHPAPPLASTDPGDPQELEDEAEGEGAFNPETGEINWDCPCLGGMAHGPCGAEFREAFSCFVYSTEDPKGINCIPRFKNMQDCFRQYPEVYAAELSDDPDSDALGAPIDDETQPTPSQEGAQEASLASTSSAPSSSVASSSKPSSDTVDVKDEETAKIEKVKKATEQVRKDYGDESARREGEFVPKAWHDATDEDKNAKAP